MSSKNSLRGKDLENYFMAHVVKYRARHTIKWGPWITPVESRNFFKVVKPLHVFKKANHWFDNKQVIVNLIIPVGALVYIHPFAFNRYRLIDTRKMRASEAYVHSIATLGGKFVSKAKSQHDCNFAYVPNTNVKPIERFSREEDQCASGIHFFINLGDAKTW